MPRPNRDTTKAKDFKGAIKRLLKELSGFKKLVIISLVLAALGAILTIVTPNILSDLTDEISKGLVLNKDNFEKLQITRFLDDWAYQANVRQMLKKTDENELALLMKEFEPIISDVLKTKVDVKYSYPWNRLFEAEIWI